MVAYRWSYGHLQVDQNLYIGIAGYYIFYLVVALSGSPASFVGQINLSGDIYTA